MKKLGFTLSEVLVTLGIIGVIAAMTVPAFVSNYQRQVFVTALHKAYNNINNSIEKYMTEQRIDDLGESELANNSDKLEEFLNKYFKSVTSGDNSFAESYSKYNEEETVTLTCDKKIRTTDGIAYCFKVTEQEGNNVISIEIDTNGPQGPNLLGRDLFQGIIVNNNGQIIPDNDTYFKQIMDANWKMNY